MWKGSGPQLFLYLGFIWDIPSLECLQTGAVLQRVFRDRLQIFFFLFAVKSCGSGNFPMLILFKWKSTEIQPIVCNDSNSSYLNRNQASGYILHRSRDKKQLFLTQVWGHVYVGMHVWVCHPVLLPSFNFYLEKVIETKACKQTNEKPASINPITNRENQAHPVTFPLFPIWKYVSEGKII